MSNGDTVIPQITANESLAEWQGTGKAAGIEGGLSYPRSSLLGEQIVQALHGTRIPMLAKEGSQWVVTNTQGTAITGQNASSFATTTPGLVLVNNNAANGAWIYPTRLRFSVTAVGTSSANWLSRWLVDTGNRYTSGGTALTPTNVNTNVTATKTGALVYFGAITAAAANASRTVSQQLLRSVIPVANDQVIFDFGNTVVTGAGQAEDGTTVLHQVVSLPPIALPPNSSLLWYDFSGSQAAARTYDNFTLEYVER